jgi:hypothetical protein
MAALFNQNLQKKGLRRARGLCVDERGPAFKEGAKKDLREDKHS